MSTQFVARVSQPTTLNKPAYVSRAWSVCGVEHHWTTEEFAAHAWRFPDKDSAVRAFESIGYLHSNGPTAILEVLEVPSA
jgi:hypothetical protein